MTTDTTPGESSSGEQRGTRTSGAAAFAEMLVGYGTSHVFFVPTVLLNTLAELELRGIKPVSAHGEKAAAYMADGYARLSGKPGICMAQTVGAANLAAGLKDASMASLPVIALTGGPYPDTLHRRVYQEIEDSRMFDGVTKWQARITRGERMPELVRQAFRAATAGAPGPVHLEASGHLGEVFDEEVPLGEVFVEPRFARTPPFRPLSDPGDIERALAILAEADRPVIVAGSGVMRSGAASELAELAERLDIPIATSLNAKACIADDHPLNVGVVGTYARRCANEVLAKADTVFFVGSSAGGLVTNKWTIPSRDARVIHLDLNPIELGRVYRTEAPLMGDVKATLSAMLAGAPKTSHEDWVTEVRSHVASWWERLTPEVLDAVPIRPERICDALSRVLPDDGVVVVDTLQSSLWTGSYLRLRGPGQGYVRCSGSLGWGLPAAIGAKCAAGDRPVVCFTGDGGIYYHLAELETAARYGISIVVVVNNNGAYGGEAHFWRGAYAGRLGGEARDMWTFGDIDFSRLAQEMGCEGVRVTQPEGIGPAIEAALASGRPSLVDVVSEPSAMADKGWG